MRRLLRWLLARTWDDGYRAGRSDGYRQCLDEVVTPTGPDNFGEQPWTGWSSWSIPDSSSSSAHTKAVGSDWMASTTWRQP
jgi:hypothetical protein